MFKLVKKNTLTAIQQELDEAEQQLEQLMKENRDLSDEVKKLHELFNNAGENSVRLDISNDVKTVVPTIKFDQDIFDKLVELGYLDDSKKNHTFAMQLALIVIAHEALTQIIETYQSPIDQTE